ncbi:MAG: glycoside hydrolase family 15 protein [Gemmatimonadota bacterium]|nr:glycoside hydrolase family 15 protein [Gemmatimonadota bacterium]
MAESDDPIGDYPPIGDYAAIGDSRTAALVSKRGSLDWLCMPRFDSESLFGALLDREKGGRFVVRPTGEFDSERRYIPRTNVLETIHTASAGTIKVTDAMPVASEDEKMEALDPEHEVLRRVECLDGEVEVEVIFDPRPCFGRLTPRVTDRGALGCFCQSGKEAIAFRSEIETACTNAFPGAKGSETLEAGDVRWAGFTYTDEDPAVVPVFGDVAEKKLARTLEWWRAWAEKCRYEGPHREAVVRSALAVKLLAYAPSGAVIAAPTTSLPEKIGGVRNWDYRYCWLRDASLTVQALMDLGYETEAHAFLSWMLHSTRRSWPELQVLYDLHGRQCPPERTLDHLEGYAGSRPVRVGNAAKDQLQLDVYGEVTDAVAEYVRRGGEVYRPTARMLVGLGQTVCSRWRDPDEGIWEVRCEPRHHTYSKVMCWVALDRLIELHEEGQIEAPVDDFVRHREEIRAAVEENGWSEEIESYTSTFGGDDLDASLLLLSRYGYVDAGDERMRKTCERVHERLGAGDLLYRYRDQPDGLPAGEGAFGIASFWAIDCVCRMGRVEEAAGKFESLLGYANDVGLYAEEIDPDSGAQLGNFPQAFTHVGLIDAALTLAECTGERFGHRAGRAEELQVEPT